MAPRRFKQVDVFSRTPFKGNPVAVVLDAEGMTDDDMAAMARWTNLSETTFVLPPQHPRADYRVRIFTTLYEMPFAGHPTLGTCHAWLEAGGKPQGDDIIQECGVGLVRIRRDGGLLAFTAPPLVRSGPVDTSQAQIIRSALGLTEADVLDAQWVDNGAGWLALRLARRDVVLGITPDFSKLGETPVGVFAGEDDVFEMRAFIAGDAMPEDPVTGSLAAGIAMWLAKDGLAPDAYVIQQGRRLGRAGEIHIARDADGIWIGGSALTLLDGVLHLPLTTAAE
ncbi:PhzF family phenazine biosynthesis protein [Luteibacter aegosomaticola]|uniref:PhzF family phenazine biosynthesis protein n=1 Tax=Luteibacter aegosomaticola TaxID=2911538 RepID=UPI001FF8C10C|nr:PhzF family phenazine biosynthesis protein [Luteibacter aegosomaticola]UPG89980.1 PhzF family phenazine biosynthesis protein [Luteibacter aegosomaticola]